MEAVDIIKETDIPLTDPLSFFNNIRCTILLWNIDVAIQTINAQLLLINIHCYDNLYWMILSCYPDVNLTFNVHSSIFNLSEVASSKVCIFAH